MEQLNGFELAGRAMRVTYAEDEDPSLRAASATGASQGQAGRLESLSDDRAGLNLGQGSGPLDHGWQTAY